MNTNLDFLIFAAHADDAEIGMGGTIAKYSRQQYAVGICDLTQAEMSSNGNVSLRKKEAELASQCLGLQYRSNLQLPDRGLTGDKQQCHAIVEEIRKNKPAVVFIPYWQDRHPDHVKCSQIVDDALFTAKLRRYESDYEAWTVNQVYYYFINDTVHPNFVVDVTDDYDVKIQALQAYQSQFMFIEGQSVATPLTNQYIERVQARDLLTGQSCQVKYAEGFISRKPLLVNINVSPIITTM
ncbi:bacillithiol biosynthesis deacetylase BshB1 [Longirhabdus pacifica]|uniref:bacillithiol biosynthesis deacetylase BshB1 n=1 Tax=Longirhabdus pacifica TaxID=2305227 RepID=UPI001008A741|nr:bacillithiol biosynthesis deacetylase BshB1 [Longirhabdus pacifica]